MQLLLSDVSSVTARKRLLDYFAGYGPVEPVQSAARLRRQPAVVVGDLHRIAERFSPESSDPLPRLARRQPMVVAGLLRTEKDRRAISRVHQVARCLDGRLLIKPFPDPRSPDEDREFVGRVLNCVSPHFLTSARYMPDGTLVVKFGDGLTGQIAFSTLRLERLGRRLLPDTARASGEGDSLQIDDETGYTVDVDCEVLRSRLDQGHADQIRQQAAEVRSEVGKRIGSARRSRKMTQLALSRKSGIAQEMISRIENGRQSPRADTLLKLARALDMPLDRLLGDTNSDSLAPQSD